MTRYVIKVKVRKGADSFSNRRDVVTTKSKDEVLIYFKNLYSQHEKSGGTVEMTVLHELPCNDIFEVL